MLAECSLNATPDTRGAKSINPNDQHYESTTDLSIAERFLKTHGTAKIIFIVDTHCLDNGYFVYTGANPETYKACSLIEVSVLYNRSPLNPQPSLCRS